MKIAFVDVVGWDYDAETPFRRPLGGTQSAAVYLAAELAAAGADVAFVNDTKAPHESRGVRFEGRERIAGQFLNAFDVVIALSAAVGLALRGAGVTKPLVFWCQHAHDQAAVQALQQAPEREAWRAFALVSEWQAGEYRRHFAIAAERISIMRNAASPAFIEAEAPVPWFATGAPPVLAYTSTPFRGLDLLLIAFPAIRELVPDAQLRVFSSMAVYGVEGQADGYGVLYSLCRALPGARYEGSLPQRDLAREMSGTAALAYPSTFAETSCIAVMEAIACGAEIVTTELGALPETAHGLGRLLPLAGSRVDFTAAFAKAVAETLTEARRDPASAARRRAARMEFARTQYTWKARAREWLAWLATLA